MHKSKVVLGSGISGFIAQLFNPDSLMITKNIGTSFPFGPSFVHKTPENETLMDKLNMSKDSRMINVGYFYNGKSVSENDLTPEILREYYEKSRAFEVKKGRLSRSFIAFVPSFSGIISKIESYVRGNRIYAEVVGINTEEGELTLEYDGQLVNVKYDNLISSIPLIDFLKMSDVDSMNYETLQYTPMTAVLLETEDIVANSLCGFDYVYILDKKSPCLRITKHEGRLILEFSGELSDEDASLAVVETLGDVGFHLCGVQRRKYGKLKTIEKLPEINGVRFVGRFGKWQDEILLQDVVREFLNENYQQLEVKK